MNDLISRQAAIDAIHGAIFDFFDICDDDEESPMTYKDEQLLEINKAISGRIKRLPSAQPVQWIPCSERLPENGHYYLWCSDMGHVQSDYYWNGFENGMKYGYNIVAWMPLPEPWRGEQDETD